MDRSQVRGLLLPLILIVIGAVALLANLNVLSADALARLADLWPLILVVIGLQFVYNRALPARTALAAGAATLVVVLAAAIGYAAVAPAGFAGRHTVDTSDTVQGLTQAGLDLSFGASEVNIQAASLGGQLYTAHFDLPHGEQAQASVDRPSGTVHLGTQGNAFNVFSLHRRIDIKLSNSLPWSIVIDGGAATMSVDLGSLHLTKFEISGGASHLDATLPKPKGTVSVSVSGGASNLQFHLPAETAYRVHVSGGASSLDVNGNSSSGVGDVSQQSRNYDSAANRYDIEINGGASHVQLTTG